MLDDQRIIFFLGNSDICQSGPWSKIPEVRGRDTYGCEGSPKSVNPQEVKGGSSQCYHLIIGNDSNVNFVLG